MKTQIHPKWFDTTVKCACGNTFTIGSTVPTIEVEVCSECHPFYTGQMKFVDSAGRVDAFQARRQAAQGNKKISKAEKRKLKESRRVMEELDRPESLADLRNQ